jgi:hypothetical protein
MTAGDGTPAWIAPLADRVREVKLPTAQLADAMRDHGEDPRDDTLWAARIGQLDMALFGGPARELRRPPAVSNWEPSPAGEFVNPKDIGRALAAADEAYEEEFSGPPEQERPIRLRHHLTDEWAATDGELP